MTYLRCPTYLPNYPPPRRRDLSRRNSKGHTLGRRSYIHTHWTRARSRDHAFLMSSLRAEHRPHLTGDGPVSSLDRSHTCGSVCRRHERLEARGAASIRRIRACIVIRNPLTCECFICTLKITRKEGFC